MRTLRTMKIIGARVTRTASHAERMDLVIRGSRFAPFGTSFTAGPEIDLSGYLLLPGLINAHDHLEFNLFPRLGHGLYRNAAEWARDIHHPERSPVKEHLAVPKRVRLLWGGLKNLLSGVTTVAHHNPYDREVFERRFPVRVIRRFGWAHSLHFSPDLAARFRNTPPNWPFVIHAAEGRDSSAFSEIERLDAMRVLDHRTVLVHAIALKPSDVELLQARKCSIVWCPSSNLFTYGQTAPPRTLDSNLPLALGTDSALTADGDMGDEIRAAQSTRRIPMERIFEMVTTRAASIFRLPKSSGEIQEQGHADVVAIADRGQSPAQALTGLCPDLVIVRGRIRLISRSLMSRNPHLRLPRSQSLSVEGRGSWWVDADISFLHRTAAEALGPEIRLAGKRVSP